MTEISIPQKWCTGCSTSKPITEFHKNQNKHGLRHRCKDCETARRWRNRNAWQDTEPVVQPETKWCPKCKTEKPSTEFYRNGSNKSGLGSHCKACLTLARQRSHRSTAPAVAIKTCSKCGEAKIAAAFFRYKRSPDGLKPQCKACQRLDHQQYYASEEKREHRRRYMRQTKADAGRLASMFKYRHSDKGKRKSLAMALQHKFGMTLHEFEQMAAKQRGRCAICRGLPNGGRKRLTVDHDHTSGVIRGLLCSNCNAALGLFRDDMKLLTKAKEYLKLHAHAGDVKSSRNETVDSAMTPLPPPFQ